MAGISLPIRCYSSDTRWGGDTRYPHTTRCYGFEPKISPPAPCRSQTAVRALKTLREVQFHRTCNASWPRRKPSKESRWATPPDSRVAGGFRQYRSEHLELFDSEAKKIFSTGVIRYATISRALFIVSVEGGLR